VSLLSELATLSPEDRQAVIDRLDDLPPDKAQAVLLALRSDILARCERDGWYWLTHFVSTRDEADQESVKLFPDKENLGYLWKKLTKHNKIALAKSRQIMASWLVAGYVTWFARFKAHKTILWQTQKEPDAHQMVCLAGASKDGGVTGRCQFIERNLPAWMRLPVKESAGCLAYPHGSAIYGIPGGKDQVRSRVASVIVDDEFAFQEEAQGVFTAVAPLIQKATQLIVLSTPNGPANTFAEVYHGYKMDLTTE
jgi:hypothetical protein